MKLHFVFACLFLAACVFSTQASEEEDSEEDSVEWLDMLMGDQPPIEEEDEDSEEGFWDDAGGALSMDQMFAQIMGKNNASMDFVQDDGTLLRELDMKYRKEDYDEIVSSGGIELVYGQEVDTGNRRQKRKAIRNKHWTNNRIPYKLASNIFSSSEIGVVQAAFNDYHRYTCLRFVPATSRDRNLIAIQNGGGCSSYVGMIGGQQPVSLARGCRIKGIVIHELGHAIGFNHEQTRPDRDGYVTIHTQNIQRGMEFNFNKFTTQLIDSKGVPYDYGSVMHYGGTAFSINGQYTIVAKDRRYQSRMGNRYGFSFSDIKLANLRYNCNSHCPKKTCTGSGFVGKDCKCWCPGTTTNPITECAGGGGGGRTTPNPTPSPSGCNSDKSTGCASYKQRGYCCRTHRHYTYMSTNCKKTCNICNGGAGSCTTSNCVDKRTARECNYWHGQGYCRSGSYVSFMRENCAKKCNLCTGTPTNCRDASTNCARWRTSGYCTHRSYITWMAQNCKQSCGKC